MPVEIDEVTLQKIADTTGGKYFRATSNDVLKNIFSEKREARHKTYCNYVSTSYRHLICIHKRSRNNHYKPDIGKSRAYACQFQIIRNQYVARKYNNLKTFKYFRRSCHGKCHNNKHKGINKKPSIWLLPTLLHEILPHCLRKSAIVSIIHHL